MARFETLCDKLEGQIASGLYSPGQPLPPVRQLMQKESLSSGTVQKSLNELERKGLLERHPNRGFFVSPSQNIPETRLPHIGMIVGNINHQAEEFLRGASTAYENSKYVISSFAAGNDPDKYDDFFNKIRKCKLAGIILTHMPDLVLHSHLEQFTQTETPMVLWGSEIPGINSSRICINFTLLGNMLARRIAQRGYKKIRLLTTYGRHPSEAEAITLGLSEQLQTENIHFGKEHVHYHKTDHGYGKNIDPFIDSQEYVTDMLKKGEDFDALVCCQEYTAVGAIRAIEKAGLSVPNDIAVISGDHCAYLDHIVDRKITSFDHHPYFIGKIAGEMLSQQIKNSHTAPQTQLMAGEIIDGDTD